MTYPPPIDPKRACAAAVAFLRDHLDASGLDGFVLGISGGVDSALAAALAVRAVGPARVHGVKMPYRTSSPASETDAGSVAAALGISTSRVDISPIVDAYYSGRETASPLRRGNYMARVRMACLFDISAARGALVVGTGNRTEILLGYGTWYGDTACSLNPNGDLYKSHIWQLARHLKLPREVVEKTPSADLWPGQTDEGELGVSYQDADAILHLTEDLGLSEADAAAEGFDPEVVRIIRAKVEKNRFKGRLPDIAELRPHP